MTSYNRTRNAEELLEKHASHPPSFAVHLHPEHWMLNNVSKFSYSTPISSLLDDIRAHRIPVDFLDIFDAARVPFYEGCMIVELLDYRQQQKGSESHPDKPERTRVVLYPNGETLFADIYALNRSRGGKWTDRDALEVEARILLATSQPLCLVPDPHLSRVVNHVMRVSTPTVPNSLKRKASVMDPEEDEVEKARRAKIMQFMAPRPGRTHAQSYRILETIQRSRQASTSKPSTPVAPTPQPSDQPVQPPLNANTAAYPAIKKLNTSATPKPGFPNGSPHGSATQTPSPSHKFANSPAAEAKRAPTPLQQQYTPAPQPPNPQTAIQPPLPQPSQPQPPARPSNTPRPPSVASFQPAVPGPQFLSQPPPARNAPDGQAKPVHPNGVAPTPPFAGNPYQQHVYRVIPQVPQPPQATPTQPPVSVNGRATPRPANASAAQIAQAKAMALAARARMQQPGNAHGQQLNFAYHSPHLRPAGLPNGNVTAAQMQAAQAAMASAQARVSPSPANGVRPLPVEGGQPMTQQQQIIAYQNMLRASGGYPVMNWQQMASRPGMPMSANNQQMLQMQMQQAVGMMSAGQIPHHSVPVGGAVKGPPGHPAR
ncbi:hypothetical protein MIND_00313800 [Mycena indigotica]|uniref:Spt20-like SEP domain-containing protein n=1 Tax=Mycena indigotica TaxID=2126181 RepID=A0A8H6T4T7_9AGAR|nr:uncharacterized protein MIND_00313800 [Mycena indigotica]KAF7309430.1 hypothetical protein MIND_00313800 [Mycena indigotica]